MKFIYKNAALAKRQAGGLNASLKGSIQALSKKHGTRVSVQDLFAVALGFNDWKHLEKFTSVASANVRHPDHYWEERFSDRLERKLHENYVAKLRDVLDRFVQDVARTHIKPIVIGADEFDDIAYNYVGWAVPWQLDQPALSNQAKFLECLKTKKLPILDASEEQKIGSPEQAQSDRLCASTDALGVFITPAHQYQDAVMASAQKCISVLGAKVCRESGIWSIDFAYDLYAAVLEKEKTEPFFFRGHPLAILELVARELGHLDYQSYHKSQQDPDTAFHDSRPDLYLSKSAQRTRAKMAEGYIFLYLEGLGLPIGDTLAFFEEIKASLSPALYRHYPTQAASLPHAGYARPFGHSVYHREAINILEKWSEEGAPLTQEDWNKIGEAVGAYSPSHEDRAFIEPLRSAIARWEKDSEGLKIAIYYLEAMASAGIPEFTFLLAQHLRKFSKNPGQISRASDLLLKVLAEVEKGRHIFHDKETAVDFVTAAGEAFAQFPKRKEKAAALQQSVQILSSPTTQFIGVEDLKCQYFQNGDDAFDEDVFARFLNGLLPEERIAVQLGFLPEGIPAHKGGGL